jgi:hypothetical protein
MTTTDDVARRVPTPLDRMGGPWGIVLAAVPVLVFVVADAFLPLSATVVVSVAAALAITGLRLLRGDALTAALGGVLGVAVTIGVVALAGPATGFVLAGIWVVLVGVVVWALRRSTTRAAQSARR